MKIAEKMKNFVPREVNLKNVRDDEKHKTAHKKRKTTIPSEINANQS